MSHYFNPRMDILTAVVQQHRWLAKSEKLSFFEDKVPERNGNLEAQRDAGPNWEDQVKKQELAAQRQQIDAVPSKLMFYEDTNLAQTHDHSISWRDDQSENICSCCAALRNGNWRRPSLILMSAAPRIFVSQP